MIGFLIWLIVVLIVAGAFLAVVRAMLALPIFGDLVPYVNVIYALVVLIVILYIAGAITGQVPGYREFNLRLP